MLVTTISGSIDLPERRASVFQDGDRCAIHGAPDPEFGDPICGRCWTNGTAAFGETDVTVAHLLTLRAVTRALMHKAHDPSSLIVRYLRIVTAANRSELVA